MPGNLIARLLVPMLPASRRVVNLLQEQLVGDHGQVGPWSRHGDGVDIAGRPPIA